MFKKNEIYIGDAKTVLQSFPENCVDVIVTSPPYFGPRDYKHANQIGREKTVSEYIDRLRDVFSECKRVLENSGTLWLNLGDKYIGGELCGIPWQVAFALKKDGWILRSDIIWHKPNAVPSSVKSRPMVDHEYLFLFSKSRDYYYDGDAIREPQVTLTPESKKTGGRKHFGINGGTSEKGKYGEASNLHKGRRDLAFHPRGRNKRTVWSVPLPKFYGSHFAVFPEKLVEQCILAGSREGMVVLDPFLGSGTTAFVAARLRRDYVGIDIDETDFPF